MATYSNAWDETIPLDNLLSGLSEAGKIDDLIRQMKLDIRERILKFAPVGMVVKWSSTIVPYGFMDCNGAPLLKATYPVLYSVIGDLHGSVDSLHFNLPNPAGKYTRGWNHSRSTGLYDPDSSTRTKSTKTGSTMSAGDHVGTEEAGAIKAHNHSYYAGAGGSMKGQYTPDFSKQLTLSDVGASGGSETRPKSIYQKYIIRVDDQTPLDGTYSYDREWDEDIPINSNYYGRMAMEIRKLREDVEALINNFFPPGMVIYWPGSVTPDGYLEMNGQEVSRTTYAELFEAIEDLYGDGDGENTFLIPDCRGLFVRADDGSSISEILADENISHTHSAYQTPVFSIWVSQWPGVTGSVFLPTPAVVNMQTTSGSYPARTVDGHPKNMYLMACIRARACA